MNTMNQEPEEVVQQWWRRHGRLAVRVLIVAFLGYAAWLYLNHHNKVSQQKASEAYVMMMYAQQEADHDTISLRAQTLINDYSNRGPYSSLAALTLAQMAVGEGRFDDAKVHLNHVVDTQNDRYFSDLARVRLARLYLNEEDTAGARAQLREVTVGSFKHIRAELLADAAVMEGDTEAAIQGYQEALDDDELGSDSRKTLVQMKLGALGVRVPEPELPAA